MSDIEFIQVGPGLTDEQKLLIKQLYEEKAAEYQAIIEANLEPKRKAARKLAEAAGLTSAEIEALFGVSL